MNNINNMNYNQGDNMNYSQNNYSMNNQIQGSTPGFTKYLTLSILQLACCSQVPGIIALVFTILFNSAYKRGDMTDYESKKKNAKIALIIGLVIGVLANIVIMGIYGVSLMATIFSN